MRTTIWNNFAIPYMQGTSIFYIAYLIISSIQLGATVDYAIYLTNRYTEIRKTTKQDPQTSIIQTISECLPSILTSGTVMAVVGLILGAVSSHGVLKKLVIS